MAGKIVFKDLQLISSKTLNESKINEGSLLTLIFSAMLFDEL
jgi:hypothetical protein